MTMLDIDCFEHGKTCEILATEDHNEYIAGDDVNVVQEGTKITETAKSYLIGEGNPETTDMTDAQKSHSLTLGFQNKSSFTIKMTIGDVWSYRAIMFSKLCIRRCMCGSSILSSCYLRSRGQSSASVAQFRGLATLLSESFSGDQHCFWLSSWFRLHASDVPHRPGWHSCDCL